MNPGLPNQNELTTGSGPSKGGAAKADRPETDIMQVLSEFESGLECLKALYIQRQDLQSRLREHEAGLSKREADLAVKTEELFKQTVEQGQLRDSLERASAELSRRESELAIQANELEKARAANAIAHKEAAERQAGLAARRQELDVQAERVAQREKVVTERADSLAAQAFALEKQKADLVAEKADAQALRVELDRTREHSAQLKATVEHRSTKIAELEQAVQTLHGRLKSEAGSRDEAIQAAGTQAAAAASRLQDLHAQLREALAQAAEFKKAADEAADAQAAATTSRLDLQAQLRDAVAQAAVYKKAADAAAGAQVTAVSGRVQELEVQLREALEQAADYKKAADEASGAQVTAASGKVHELETQLREALEQAAAFRRAAEDKPRITGDLALLRRRQRLRRCRELIREQTAKVKKGSEAIKKRYQQLENLMAQRSELVAARDKIIEAERKLQHARAANRAAVVSLCAVATFGILGGLSWALARELAPATFIASSWLKADGPSRELNDAELEEWQRYHEDLLKDPQFHAVAAERFKRQAVTSLASPSAVSSLIASSVTTQSPANGELKLELTGEGSDNTARTLDTITAAFASHANAAQQKRIDGGRTVVSQAAKPSSDPVDNTRTLYALAMAGVGVAGAGALAMFVWRRLTGVKTDFERDGQVAAALAGSHWPDPTKEG